MTRVALYLRVSTREQTTDNQRRELEAWAAARGYTLDPRHIFEDAGISGAKGRDKRPGYDKALKAAVRKEFDVLAAWSIDRLGRSLRHLVNGLGDLQASGCDLYLHKQAIDTTTPTGRAMLGMISVFAEFEREIIRERVITGIDRVKATGKTRTGKPIGRPKIAAKAKANAVEALQAGKSVRATADLSGLSVGAVQRLRGELGMVAPAVAQVSV